MIVITHKCENCGIVEPDPYQTRNWIRIEGAVQIITGRSDNRQAMLPSSTTNHLADDHDFCGVRCLQIAMEKLQMAADDLATSGGT